MRVLEVHRTFLPTVGGVEIHMFDLCHFLEASGSEAFVLASEPAKPRFQILSGVKVFRVSMPRLFVMSRIPYLFSLALAIAYFGRRLSVDVVHAHDLVPGFASSLAFLALRKPVVITIHSPIQNTSPFSSILFAPLTFLLKRGRLPGISKMICVSDYTYSKAIRFGVPSTLLTMIHDWIPKHDLPLDTDGQIDEPILESSYSRIILFVGRLSREKGLENLIAATRILLYRKIDVVLLLAGTGPQKEQLHQYANELGIVDRILFLGRISDAKKKDLMARSSVFVSASTGGYEGLGLSVLEAMHSNLAVVSTRGSGTQEALGGGKFGILTDSNPNSIAESLIVALDNQKKLDFLRNAAKQYVDSEYNYEIQCQKVTNELLSALNPSGGRRKLSTQIASSGR